MNWLVFWLFLHITAAVIAFGPTFVFPIIGSQARKHPANMAFALELNHLIELRLVLPVAVTMLISGVGLIFAADINLLRSTFLWVAVLLYLAAMTIALTVLLPTTSKLVAMTHATAAPAGAAGPPPEMMRLIKRLQGFGGFLTLLFLTIIFLMIVQPGGIVPGPIFG